MRLPAPTGPDPLRRLSQELHELSVRFADHRVTVRELSDALGERASALLSIILALPMCAPVSIPGLSLPFGVVIFVLAARFTLGLPPWLPERLFALTLPAKFFRGLLEGTSKLVGWIERRLRPRWAWLTGSTGLVRMHSCAVCFAALLLLLPLVGIPFTNTLPALVIVVGILGIMERDGVAVVVAYGLLLTTVVYFSLSATVIIELFQKVRQWFAG